MLTFEELKESIEKDIPQKCKQKKDVCAPVKKQKEAPCRGCEKKSTLCLAYPCIEFVKFLKSTLTNR